MFFGLFSDVFLQGKNPWRFADKKHLHHRLLNLGLTQRQTVFSLFAFSSIFGISGLFLQSRGKFFALLVLALIMIIIVIVFNYLDRHFVSEKPKLLLHVCCAPCVVLISHVMF
jgi:UDP-GlcNAc:undecaprenyl-phosphate GlcNAc-1-phosphate transferase